jgi:hypothetical protein
MAAQSAFQKDRPIGLEWSLLLSHPNLFDRHEHTIPPFPVSESDIGLPTDALMGLE